jgi:RimJ/RimL family protein N-acetyltransferase
MNLRGRHLTLRAIEPDDLPKLQVWANDPALQRLLGGWQFPVSRADQQAWLGTLSCRSNDQRFAIDADGIGLVGTANLVSIDWKNRTAFTGLMIGDPGQRGRGLGRDAIMAVMRHAFDELDLAQLDTDIIEYNTASLKVHVEHCGWEVQGVKRGWYFREGRRWDKVIIGIDAARYRELVARTHYWEGA